MEKLAVLMAVICLIFSIGVLGCGQQKASSVSEVIKTAETMPTVKAKVDYLIGQANAFYNSKEYQQVVDIANYILSKVDRNSQDARSLLEKAKTALSAAAKNAASDVTKGLGF
ncbi:MAG: hypothetical protein PHP73_01205 [Candidatus Omnitrophica bacterium]|nr:hypothetical protein [Candidatus Omnitrophota bacterium]